MVRRKVIGLLLLALVVSAGIVFVELGTRPPASASVQGDVFRVVLGGSPPRATPLRPAPPATPGSRGPAAPATPSGAGAGGAPGGATTPGRPGSGAEAPQGGASPPAEFQHTVRPGETLSGIAGRYLGSGSQANVERIVRRNRLRDPNQIRPNLVLAIPVERYVEVVTDGAQSLADLASAHLGGSADAYVLHLANPGLAAPAGQRLPRGTRVLIPR